MDNCLICLEPNHYLRSRLPECGRCHLYYHVECYEGIRKLGLNCPICRIPIYRNHNNQYYFDYFDYAGFLFQLLERTVFRLFMTYPNILTFILLQLIAVPISFLIIIPYAFFMCVKISFRKIYQMIFRLSENLLFQTPIRPGYLLEDIRILFQ
jgi:hypothetical protein